MDLATLDLDWNLALRRFARDIRDDFFPDPIRFGDLTRDRAATLAKLAPQLETFSPVAATIYDVPKRGLTLRCCLHLRPIDRLVYQALVDALADDIEGKLSPAVYNNRLRGPGHDWMFKSGVQSWKRFESDVAADLRASPNSIVVCTDIAQFFEHLDLYKLRRHLEMLCEPLTDRKRSVIDTLIKCLQVWSPFKHKGLPQNMDPSSCIGSAFLDYVDKRMLAEGYKYRRYMDDIRVVVSNESEARVAIKRLTSYLRDVGLGLNSAKTEMLLPASAGHAKLMAGGDGVIEEIEESLNGSNVTQTQLAIPRLVEKLRSIIADGIVDGRGFRFCVNRIASLMRSPDVAIGDLRDITAGLIEALVNQPSDTDTICRYLSIVPLEASHTSRLVELFCSEDRFVYEWQNYQLWILLVQRKIKAEALLLKAHKVRDTTMQPEVAGAALYLGAFGSYADREALRIQYATEMPLVTRRALCVAVQELHPSDRASFYRDRGSEELSVAGLGRFIDETHPGYVPQPDPLPFDQVKDAMPDVIS